MQTSLILNVSENAYGSIVCLNDLVFVLETRYNFLTLINFINLLLNILFKLLHIMIMHTVSEWLYAVQENAQLEEVVWEPVESLQAEKRWL